MRHLLELDADRTGMVRTCVIGFNNFLLSFPLVTLPVLVA
jgi:hypothetical protein